MRTSRLAQNGYEKNNNKNSYNNFDFNPYQQNNYHISNGGVLGQNYRYSNDSKNNQYLEPQKTERPNIRYQENEQFTNN